MVVADADAPDPIAVRWTGHLCPKLGHRAIYLYTVLMVRLLFLCVVLALIESIPFLVEIPKRPRHGLTPRECAPSSRLDGSRPGAPCGGAATFYRQAPHSALGMQSPAEFYAAWKVKKRKLYVPN